MARYTEHDRRVIDQVAERWRDECLIEDGSLLFPGEAIWSLEATQELVERFVDNELTDSRTFDEKLIVQLEPASTSAKRLMAEVIAVYFLFTSSVSGRRKREVVDGVLAFAGDDPLRPDGDVGEAFDNGIGGPGQAFNSYRPVLLAYLISFARRFKAIDDHEERQLYLSDPWEFKAWLVGENDDADGGRQMMRELVLHLLFPDDFERIASGDHKAAIRDALEGLLTESHEDIDRSLLAIRERVAELVSDPVAKFGALDFYKPGLRETWDPSEGGEEDDDTGISHLAALEIKRQAVLYGPPGTGKTHEAKDLARRLLRHQALLRWGAVVYFENLERIEEFADKQVRRLQLHQAYSYEDFVRGLRIADGGATVPQDGYLLNLIEEIEGDQAAQRDAGGLDPLPWVLLLDEMNRVDLSRLLGECFAALEDRDAEVDLPALDPGGKVRRLRIPPDLYFIGTLNLIDQSVEQLDFALRRRFLWLRSGFRAEVIPEVVEQRWKREPRSGHHEWWRLRDEVDRLAGRAAELNAEIAGSRLLGEQYELGHTYFFDVAAFIARWPKVGARGHRPRGYLWKTGGDPQPPIRDLWRHSLRPLLSEYLAGIDPEARRVELDRLARVFFYGSDA